MRGVAERGSEVKEASAAQFRSLSITDKSVLCVCVGTGFGTDATIKEGLEGFFNIDHSTLCL